MLVIVMEDTPLPCYLVRSQRIKRVFSFRLLTIMLLTALAAIFSSPSARGQNVFWTGGGGDGLWNDPANWSTGTVPSGPTFNAAINGSGTFVSVMNTAPSVLSLQIGHGAELSVNLPGELFVGNGSIGSLTNAGLVGLGNTTIVLNAHNAQINNSGNIDLEGFSTFISTIQMNGSATLFGGGNVNLLCPPSAPICANFLTAKNTLTNVNNNIGGGGYIQATTLLNGGTINSDAAFIPSEGLPLSPHMSIAVNNLFNSGTLEATNNSLMTITTNPGGFVNVGNVIAAQSSTITLGLADYLQLGGTTTVNGNLTVTSSNQMMDILGGTVLGTGTINSNVFSNGTFKPGSAGVPGMLTINGSYTQGALGTLTEQITGVASGTGFSMLDVNGSIDLAGSLDIKELNGFVPFDGEAFDILNYLGTEEGTFANASPTGFQMDGWNWDINYDFDGDEVVLTAVSPDPPGVRTAEPGELLLLATGLLALGACHQRKRAQT
jgi:hypothetical protein